MIDIHYNWYKLAAKDSAKAELSHSRGPAACALRQVIHGKK